MPTLSNPKERDLFFYEQFTQESIKKITESIVAIESSDLTLAKEYKVYDLQYNPAPIKLRLDSYGGTVYQCFGLLSIIEKCTTPIHTIATGCAMSCGFLTLISGHKRLAYDRSTILIHSISSGAHGKIADMETELVEVQRLEKMIDQFILSRTKLTKKILSDIRKEKKELFLSAQDAKKHGIIDEII